MHKSAAATALLIDGAKHTVTAEERGLAMASALRKFGNSSSGVIAPDRSHMNRSRIGSNAELFREFKGNIAKMGASEEQAATTSTKPRTVSMEKSGVTLHAILISMESGTPRAMPIPVADNMTE